MNQRLVSYQDRGSNTRAVVREAPETWLYNHD